MAKIMPIGMQLQKLQVHLSKHGHDPELFDLRAHMDPTLNYAEQRENISAQLGIRSQPGQLGWRDRDPEYRHMQCMSLQERCELDVDQESCQEYADMGCHQTYGDVIGLDGKVVKPRRTPKAKATPRPRQKPKPKPKVHPASAKAAYVTAYSKRHAARPKPKPVKKAPVKKKATSCKMGYKSVFVSGYTVPAHTRCMPTKKKGR